MNMSDNKCKMVDTICEAYLNGVGGIREALAIYRQSWGDDEFANMIDDLVTNEASFIKVIALYNNDRAKDMLNRQLYPNIDFIKIEPNDSVQELVDYFEGIGAYIWIVNDDYLFDNDYVYKAVRCNQDGGGKASVIISSICYSDENGDILEKNENYNDQLSKLGVVDGNSLLEYALIQRNNTNVLGSVHNSLFEKELFSSCQLDIDKIIDFFDEDVAKKFLHELIRGNSAIYAKQFVYKTVKKSGGIIDDVKDLKIDYKCSKEITFFYTDKGEYYNLEPIGIEAEKRGYEVKFTTNLLEKAEIGVYCQHVCYPENSKFSLVLLHDMAQGHNRWPNLWTLENWNKFDIGILPGEFWGDMWSRCACFPYANPRVGTFVMGYPKADKFKNVEGLSERAEQIKKEKKFKYDVTVLYAPSWENDEKEDDFVRALHTLPVNLLIKQAQWPKDYQFVIDDIYKMRAMHENVYENVYYIEPDESIMVALELCDVMVSDESSVMTEALLLHKPALAVYDWVIPDTYPPRRASVPFDYVEKCKRVELREYVEKFVRDRNTFSATIKKGDKFYSNIGECCNDIMDAIDYYVANGNRTGFMKHKLHSRYTSI